MDFFGTTARDSIVGTVDADVIDVTQGGRDTVQAGDGDDIVYLGGELKDNDQIDGGDGYDEAWLDGNYFGGLTLLPTTLVNFEAIVLERGFNYNIVLDDAVAAAGQIFDISASLLRAGDSLVLDASAETDATLAIHGGDGDDILTGPTTRHATFYLHGGEDTINGGQLFDTVWIYDSLSVGDVIDLGPGIDTVSFGGDYSAGLTITGSMLIDVEEFTIDATGTYDLVVTDDICRAVNTFEVKVQSGGAPAGNDLVFDGSAETDGHWQFIGGISDDTLIGGALSDTFDFIRPSVDPQGGNDAAIGGDGDDVASFNEAFTRDDQFDGGDGFDELLLEGDLSGGVNFRSTTLTDVEQITLGGGYSYSLTVGNNNVRAEGFVVDASGLIAGETLTYDGSAESASDVIITGGLGDDVITTGGGNDSLWGSDGADSLTAGAGDDTLRGNRGQDTLQGGLGADHIYGDKAATTFVFTSVADSTGPGHDVLGTLKPLKDHFDLDVAVTGVDARVNAGSLSAASFDADLAGEIDAAALAAGHAVVIKPNAGDLAGHFFLVVDANAIDGYQAGADYVMEFAAGSNPNAIAAGFFV